MHVARHVSRTTNKRIKFVSIFASYYALLCICYCFSHLIGLFSVTWLSLLYKFTRLWFFIYFLFLSDEGPTLKTLDFIIRIGSTPTFLYFDLYLYTQPTQFVWSRGLYWKMLLEGFSHHSRPRYGLETRQTSKRQ